MFDDPFADAASPALDLLRAYMRQHGRHSLSSDLTGRRFVVGRYACPEQLGNRMSDFLNAFIGAIVSNRTLLWQYCSDKEVCPYSGSVEGCDAVYRRRAWMASSDEVLPRLGLVAQVPRYPKRLEPAPFRFMTPSYLARHPSADQLSCCGVDRLHERALDFGVVERREMAALASRHATLGDAARRRAAQLFHDGVGVAYGAAFRAAFRASPQLVAASRREAQPQLQKLRIGMHLRHQQQGDDGSRLSAPLSCLRRLVSDGGGGGNGGNGAAAPPSGCTVLLASDRAATLERAPDSFGGSGCNVVASGSSRAAMEAATTAAGTTVAGGHAIGAHGGRRASSVRPPREHGPFGAAGAARDLELLTGANGGFIGTEVSSLSFLMYARAALAQLLRLRGSGGGGSDEARLVMHTLPGCRQQPAMPPAPSRWGSCRETCRGVTSEAE